MRRASLLLVLVAIVLTILSMVTGVAVLHSGAPVVDAEGGGAFRVFLARPQVALHAVFGHLVLFLTMLVAAASFLLALQGLLEPHGRRKPSCALLLILSPVVMGCGLAADASGYLGGRSRALQAEISGEAHVRFVDAHSGALSVALLMALALTGLVLAHVGKSLPGEDEST